MPDLPPFGRFFLPGPTEVLPEVLEAQVGPMTAHRSKDMEALIARVQPGLKTIFRTERPVYIAASSATGFMEAALRNGARRRVLALVNGAFSERFQAIARANGLEADALDVGWGGVHTADRVADALKKGDYDAVTVVHCETSTGVLNPIGEIAAAAHASGDVAVLVDAVSSMAGAPVETDAWGLDFVLTGSQKCLALPPGLALGVAQGSVLERASAKPDRGVYFDFLAFEKNLEKNQTPNTPAVSLIYALAAQVERIERETIEARWERHEAMARRTWAWVEEMRDRGVDISILAPEGYRSPTVTCINVPPGRTGPEIAAAVKARGGYTIAPGYGKLKDQTFRIGHMGDHTVEELESLLEVLAEVLVG